MPPRLGSERPIALRLLHIDSDELFLAGFSAAAAPGWHVTSMVITQAIPAGVTEQHWDVCVLGISQETMSEAFAWLLHVARCEQPILAWMSRDIAACIPTLNCFRVAGYVSRSASADELRQAVLDVAAGERYVDRRLQAHAPTCELASLTDLGLTSQQQRVATLYALYGNRRRAAAALCLSENTVKYHLRMIYAKTGASSLHGLQQVLRSRGWAPPDPPRATRDSE
jgi:DNA-binding NarL/FixJ family response regulator